MTDNEIIKALNRWTNNFEGKVTELAILCNALDLINRQKEQIEALIAGQETLQKALNEKIEEVEKLQIRLRKERHQFADLSKTYSVIRAEAVKEFAEDIINNILPKFMTYGHEEIALRISFAISRKAKEMEK